MKLSDIPKIRDFDIGLVLVGLVFLFIPALFFMAFVDTGNAVSLVISIGSLGLLGITGLIRTSVIDGLWTWSTEVVHFSIPMEDLLAIERKLGNRMKAMARIEEIAKQRIEEEAKQP